MLARCCTNLAHAKLRLWKTREQCSCKVLWCCWNNLHVDTIWCWYCWCCTFVCCKCVDLQSRHWPNMCCPPLERAFSVPCMYPDVSWLQCPVDCCISLKTDHLSKIRNSHARWELDASFGHHWRRTCTMVWRVGKNASVENHVQKFHMIAGTLACYNMLWL